MLLGRKWCFERQIYAIIQREIVEFVDAERHYGNSTALMERFAWRDTPNFVGFAKYVGL